MKLACVIHRFGADIAGGSESPCRVVAEHLISRFDHHPFVFGHGLSTCFLDAMLNDELVNLGHIQRLHELRPEPQPWSLSAQASRKGT